MAKRLSSLTDPENDPVFVPVEGESGDQEQEGMSVEDAYRFLAEMPREPVLDPEE